MTNATAPVENTDLITPTEALPLVSTGDPITDLINRVTSDPNATVETLERVIGLRDREQAAAAEREFNAAFSAAQRDMPAIPKRGKSHVSEYALWEDVNQRIIKTLSQHDLSISYTSSFEQSSVCVTATVRHSAGHSIEGQFVAPIEGSKAMNAAQARGSAMTYGKRYATINLLSLTTHGEDDDAFKSGATESMMPFLDAIAEAQTLEQMAAINLDVKRDQTMTGKERSEVVNSYKVKYTAIKKTSENA